MLKRPIAEVLLGFLVLSAGQNAARCGEIEAWDAPVPAQGKEFQTDQRARIGSRLKRETSRIARSWTTATCSWPLSPAATARSSIRRPRRPKRRRPSGCRSSITRAMPSPPVRSIRLASRSSAEAVVQLTLGGEAKVGEASNLSQVSLKLRTGRSFVEIADAQRIAGCAGRRCDAIRLQARPLRHRRFLCAHDGDLRAEGQSSAGDRELPSRRPEP